MRSRQIAVPLAVILVIGWAIAPSVSAETAPTITFEPPTYTTGSINGQDGWSATGQYDYGVVDTSLFGSPAGFGAQSFRISNAVTSGSFGDWAFSKSLANDAGEPTAESGGSSAGTRQPHFEASFDIASATPTAEQPGLQISVSPDRGDGARMSFLRFRDNHSPDGLSVEFSDYQDHAPFGSPGNLPAGCGPEDDFTLATVTSELDRSNPHHVALVMDFVPGPRNDVVRVFVERVGLHRHVVGGLLPLLRGDRHQPNGGLSLLQARTSGGMLPELWASVSWSTTLVWGLGRSGSTTRVRPTSTLEPRRSRCSRTAPPTTRCLSRTAGP